MPRAAVGYTAAMGRAAIFGIGGVVAAIVLIVVAILVIDAVREEKIDDGVRIGTVAVGGKTRDEARALVRRELGDAPAERVRVSHERKTYVLRPQVIRARLDVDATVDAALSTSSGTVTPRFAFSRGALDDFAARLAKRVNRQARDADIEWHDGKLDRTRARPGLEVQQAPLVATLASAVSSSAAPRTVKLPVKVTERPDRTFEDLAKRYPTVIAVDRDGKTLRLYKHLKLDKRYKIAVGQAGLETAAGRYKVAEKIVNPDWHVPDSDWAGDLAGTTVPAGDPQNPLEARWMGFHDGQGIHGTADVASLGTAASHGCIRMSVPAVKELYTQVKVGTPLFLQ